MLLGKKLIVILAILCSHIMVRLECRPLNILFVVGYFPAPSQAYILNMMTGLIDRGHKVSIFAFRKNDSGLNQMIEKYSLMDSVIYEKFPQQLPECDIVFCQLGSLGKKIFEMSRLTDWLKQRKLVVCLRGSDITSNVKDNADLYKKLFVGADLFLPVCDYFKKRLIALGCNPDKIVVHHSAINCSQFFFKKREKPKQAFINLVSVCRLVKKKGLTDAIKAVAQVIKTHKNIHFTIVGEGSERVRLEKLIKDLNVTDKVTLAGWKQQEEVVSILNDSHIFLLPSTTSASGLEEGIANALKEAMAMGLISIGTWHAGTPELIEDGVSGFLVEEKNVAQLAAKIDYIIKHPEVWGSVQVAARKKIEDEFETKKMVEELEKIFYRLLG